MLVKIFLRVNTLIFLENSKPEKLRLKIKVITSFL